MKKEYDLVILGANAAGMSAASQARRQSENLSIAVFEKGEDISYASCGLPYFISGLIPDPSQLFAVSKDKFTGKKNIEIHTGHEAIKVSFSDKTVTLRSSSGEQKCKYGKLVISTGARAFIPPLEGIKNKNIFTLRSFNDGVRIKNFIESNNPRNAVIIGGGFIGLEMAESFVFRNIKTSIVEMLPSPASTMSGVIQKIITGKLIEKGVELFTSEKVEHFNQEEERVSVHLASGKKLQADIVIVSVGVLPNTEFLKGSGLSISDRGVILINEKSETNIKDVYAAGDCASVMNLITEKSDYIPLGSTANKQGRVAGLQAAGVRDETFPGVVGSQFVKIFDLEIGKTGFNSSDAKRAGIPHETVSVEWKSIAGYCPNSEKINVTMTINPVTRQIIGGEVAGTLGAALRTNAIAVAISAKMTVDQFAYLDLGYAPPFSPVWDSLLAAAQQLKKVKKQ